MPRLAVDIRLLYTPEALLAYVMLGLFLAPFALLYVVMFRGSERIFKALERKGLPRIAKPVIGALLAGLVGLLVPHVLGSGREATARAILEIGVSDGDLKVWGLSLSLSLVIIAIAKMAATSLSIGSGGSGGVFAPGIMIGSLLGGSFGLAVSRALSDLPPETFSYMGMAVLFGAAAKAPQPLAS